MKCKTIFIDSQTLKSKSKWGLSIEEINGDQLARDVDAAILEKENEGYELYQAMPVTSPALISSAYVVTPTTGVLLIFKLKEQ